MRKKILCIGCTVILALLGLTLSFSSPLIKADVPKLSQERRGLSLQYSEQQLDSIERLFPNLTLIHQYRTVILTALSFYPDLREVSIEFCYNNEATTMACRPVYSSLFSKKRHYRIFINNAPDFEGILLHNVPFNAQIGVIGHELAHVAQYEHLSTIEFVQLGLTYLNERGKRMIERTTDEHTIERGLGWQLKEWAQYSMYDSPHATAEYKLFKQRIYMSPSEIENAMEKYSIYNHPK